MRKLVADGSTVLLTTQYLEEADALADEITVIDHGRVIAHARPDGLKRVVGGQRLEVRPADPARPGDVAAILADVIGSAPERAGPRRRHRAGRRRRRCSPTRSAGWPTAGIAVTELSLHLPSLDEVFFTLTGWRATDDDRRGRAA